jgi:hypothetical protein
MVSTMRAPNSKHPQDNKREATSQKRDAKEDSEEDFNGKLH